LNNQQIMRLAALLYACLHTGAVLAQSFAAPVNYPSTAQPFSSAAADFNGDGKLDLVVGSHPAATTLSIRLGNGDGTFQAATDYAVSSTRLVATADFNRDGKVDVVAINQSVDTVSILLGNGDGTLGAAVAYPVGAQPTGLAVADFNGDGKLDLAVGAFTDSSISILLGNGDGTFQPRLAISLGSVFSVASGDFNGDGHPDCIVGDPLFDDPAAGGKVGASETYLGCPASWSNYGAGWPGTLGVPSLTARGEPGIGTTCTLDLSNSLGSATPGLLLIGVSSTSTTLSSGATLLVIPSIVVALTVPAGGLVFSGDIPNDPSLCFVPLFLQGIELDAGAVGNLSFTAGLELDLGFDL
jgi:hypothetical protein